MKKLYIDDNLLLCQWISEDWSVVGLKYPLTECLCLVCFRDYLARRVPDTNLLFVIISPACPNCYEPASSKNLVQEPVEMALAGEFL